MTKDERELVEKFRALPAEAQKTFLLITAAMAYKDEVEPVLNNLLERDGQRRVF